MFHDYIPLDTYREHLDTYVSKYPMKGPAFEEDDNSPLHTLFSGRILHAASFINSDLKTDADLFLNEMVYYFMLALKENFMCVIRDPSYIIEHYLFVDTRNRKKSYTTKAWIDYFEYRTKYFIRENGWKFVVFYVENEDEGENPRGHIISFEMDPQVNPSDIALFLDPKEIKERAEFVKEFRSYQNPIEGTTIH